MMALRSLPHFLRPAVLRPGRLKWPFLSASPRSKSTIKPRKRPKAKPASALEGIDLVTHDGQNAFLIIDGSHQKVADNRRIIGYMPCREFDLELLQEIVYSKTHLRPNWTGQKNERDTLHLQISASNHTPDMIAFDFVAPPNNPDDVRDIFWFREGTMVSFGVTHSMAQSILDLIEPTMLDPFEEAYQDGLSFEYGTENRVDFERDVVYFSRELTHVQKLTCAHCLFQSLQLEPIELLLTISGNEVTMQASLFFEHYGSRPSIVAWMQQRFDPAYQHIWTQSAVLSSIAQLLLLTSELQQDRIQGHPEYLWETPQFERLYDLLDKGFGLTQRLEICIDQREITRDDMELVREHLFSKYEYKLEWIIIAVISTEALLTLYDSTLIRDPERRRKAKDLDAGE